MNPSALRRLLIAAGCLGLLVAAAGEAYTRLQFFSGELCIALERSERTVVRPATNGRLPLELDGGRLRIQRSVGAGTIAFEDPETLARILDGSAGYDAVQLPFPVRLKRIEVLEDHDPQQTLEVSSPDSKETFDLVVGRTVDIEGQPFEVAAIRKWAGLLRDRRGLPMAVLSLHRPGGPWTEAVFLDAAKWRRVEPGIGIRLFWLDSEALAREAVAQGLPDIKSARWGAVDGPAINWFQSFAPGVGATLSDGTTVTLLQIDEDHPTSAGNQPAIHVEIEKGNEKQALWVTANAQDADALVQFEFPSKLETVILLYAYRDGVALASVYHSGQLRGTTTLNAGVPWLPDGSPYELRLDQTLATALPVPRKDSTVYEAVLRSGGRELRLRQGEAIRCGDALLQFVRTAEPPVVRYELAVGGRALSIGPEEAARFGDWVFSQGGPSREPLRTGVLRVEHVPKRTWGRLGLAVALAAVVCIALLPRADNAKAE